MKTRPNILNLTSLLLFVMLLPVVSCQRNKLNSNELTTVHVKRDLPAPLTKPDTTTNRSEAKDTVEFNVASTLTPKKENAPRPELKKEGISRPNATKTNSKSYHIIVASHPNKNLAEQTLAKLHAKGYDDAQIIMKDNRYRVSIGNYTDKKEAFEQRDKLAEQLGQDDLWITLY